MLLDALMSNSFKLEDLIISIVASLIVIFLTLPVHEFAHGFAANKLGDPTARYQGRLTLNPLAHIDYLGALLILLVGFGWAKPVPVNSYYFKKPKRDIAITALAGPLANILMALLALILKNAVLAVGYAVGASVSLLVIEILSYVMLIFQYVAIINISLAVFNLIPIPPLDGSRLLFAFLPDKYYYRLMQYERYLVWGVFLLVMVGALDVPLYAARSFIYNGVNFIATLPFTAFI